MTDTEAKRREAICKVANIKDIGDLSDGFHTFKKLRIYGCLWASNFQSSLLWT